MWYVLDFLLLLTSAARNYTVGMTADGQIHVWGRNDKSQLGLGAKKKAQSAARRIIIKATKGAKAVDLPEDNCIEVPTLIPGLRVVAPIAITAKELETQIMSQLSLADQHTLTVISRFFTKNNVPLLIVARIHLMAGNILHAVDTLAAICERLASVARSPVDSADSIGLACKSSTPNTLSPNKNVHRRSAGPCNANKSPNNPKDINSTTNGNTVSSESVESSSSNTLLSSRSSDSTTTSLVPSTRSADESNADFDETIDQAWNLLRSHPMRDVQTAVLLKMLYAQLPIYHRLASDPRLCRLLDSYIELNVTSTHSDIPRKLVDLNTRDRLKCLKTARLPTLSRYNALREKCDRVVTSLRFFNECGHYEKYVIESGPGKMQFAAMRNIKKKCSKCLLRNRLY
jgi:hypothetical protein